MKRLLRWTWGSILAYLTCSAVWAADLKSRREADPAGSRQLVQSAPLKAGERQKESADRLVYNFDDGLQGWTQIYPAPPAAGLWEDGHLGSGHDRATETRFGRSPQFYLTGTGALTFLLKGGQSPIPKPGFAPSAIPAEAVSCRGFMGLALRDVAADAYVLWKIRDGNNDKADGWQENSFSAEELAPFVRNGKPYTLDFIEYNKDYWGWVHLDNVSIPGSASSPVLPPKPAAPLPAAKAAAAGTPPPADYSKRIPYWRTLLLVYKSIDSDYVDPSGKRCHVSYTLTPEELGPGVFNFRNFPSLANMGSDGECLVLSDVVYVDRPITTLTQRGKDSCWPSPADTRPEMDSLVSQGYDSVMVLFPTGNTQTKQFIPTGYWGLGMGPNSGSKGATYAAVSNVPEWMWGNNRIFNRGQVWLHEWLHGVCGYYRNQKVAMTSGDADGGGGHHYEDRPDTGWMDFYHDLMTGNVKEGAQRTGITARAWRSGAPLGHTTKVLADFFWTNTLSRYQVTGACAWDLEQHAVVLEKGENAFGSLLSTITYQKSYTVSSRINIPDSAVTDERADFSLIARHGQSEFSGVVSFGKTDKGQPTLSIARNRTPIQTCAVKLKPGWQTVRFFIDRGSSALRLKVWSDDENEPDWQIAHTFMAPSPVTGAGCRYEGPGRLCVDDFLAVEGAPERLKTASQKRVPRSGS